MLFCWTSAHIGQGDAPDRRVGRNRKLIEMTNSQECDCEDLRHGMSPRFACSASESSATFGWHVVDQEGNRPICGSASEKRANETPEVLAEWMHDRVAKSRLPTMTCEKGGRSSRVNAARPTEAAFTDINTNLEAP